MLLQIAFHCVLPFASLAAVPHDAANQETTCNRYNTSQEHFRVHLHSM